MSSEQTQVVMITGAAGNLGRAARDAFAGAGARLVLIDLAMEALQAAYPVATSGQVLLAADLLDEASIAAAGRAAVQEFGRIDVLCNIAGGFYYGEPVHEMRAAVWQRMLNLNATTVINAVKAVVPGMVAAGSGTVINIGAALHIQGHANMSAYAASKSAALRLTESMAEELRDCGVNVFGIMPNIIDTAQNRADMPNADFSGWTPPSAIADVMVLLTQPAAAIMSGSLIPLNGKPRSV